MRFKRLYDKNELWFGIVWIIIYCVLTIPIRGAKGDESIEMLAALAAISVCIGVFIRMNRLEGKYGLDHWPENTRRFMYFIPMWILSTGNLWGGMGMAYIGKKQVFAVISMILIGYVEEVVFRGFLFRGLLKRRGLKAAVTVSAVTFGIGHILNLFAGQTSAQTVLQVVFAVMWGLIFTLVYLKSGSLLPCIIAHSLVDVFSKFCRGGEKADIVYVCVTIIAGGLYCIYMLNKKTPEEKLTAGVPK